VGISRLQIRYCRNLHELELLFGPESNIIWGQNGSGKSSILEAIYLLCLGRSFRASVNRSFITYEQASCTIFGELDSGHSIGLEKSRNGQARLRINQENQNSVAAVARLVPLQLMDPASFELLDGPSILRKQFLHWGLFHVEQSFFVAWQQYQRALKQRNQCLRSQAGESQLETWTHECQVYGEPLKTYYEQYLRAFMDVFTPLWQKMAPDLSVTFQLHSGWDSQQTLFEALQENLTRDREQFYTHVGPHRADIKILDEYGMLRTSFSRGQKKLLLLAMKLAQGQLLFQQTNKRCLYLIDDLAAELDEDRRELVATVLRESEAQVFITAIDLGQLEAFRGGNEKLFHVEQGQVV